MAAIFNSLRSFSGRQFSICSISFSLFVNHLVCSGASNTISLKSSESDKLFKAVFKKSKSCCIELVFTSRWCTFCVLSRHISSSLSVALIFSVNISLCCLSSLQVTSNSACFS